MPYKTTIRGLLRKHLSDTKLKLTSAQKTPFNFFLLIYFLCVHTHDTAGTYVEVRGQLWELVLTFHHEGPGNWTQVLGLGSKFFYPKAIAFFLFFLLLIFKCRVPLCGPQWLQSHDPLTSVALPKQLRVQACTTQFGLGGDFFSEGSAPPPTLFSLHKYK